MATVPPRAFWPDLTAAVAFLFLRSTRHTVLVEASSTNVAPSGPRTAAFRSIGGLPSFGLNVYRSRELTGTTPDSRSRPSIVCSRRGSMVEARIPFRLATDSCS